MSARPGNPVDLPDTDFADRTLEVDMRWLLAEKSVPPAKKSESNASDDPTVVLDLTATQVHDMLSKVK